MQNLDETPLPAPFLSLAAAARRAVERLAPEETPFLDDVLAAWEPRRPSRPRGSRRASAGTVGMGLDVTLVAETVLAVLSGAAAEVLGAVATDAWQRRPGRRRGTGADPVPAVEQQVALTAGQSDRLRAACRRHAITLGLSAGQADLLADAVHDAIENPERR